MAACRGNYWPRPIGGKRSVGRARRGWGQLAPTREFGHFSLISRRYRRHKLPVGTRFGCRAGGWRTRTATREWHRDPLGPACHTASGPRFCRAGTAVAASRRYSPSRTFSMTNSCPARRPSRSRRAAGIASWPADETFVVLAKSVRRRRSIGVNRHAGTRGKLSRNDSVRATGARPLGRRNVRPVSGEGVSGAPFFDSPNGEWRSAFGLFGAVAAGGRF